MSLEGAPRQKARQLALPLESRGETLGDQRSGEAPAAARGDERLGTDHLLEEVVERGDAEGYLGLPANLNFPNRRIRTRTSGGVGGA